MLGTILVLLAVATAAFFVTRSVYRTMAGKKKCCGCASECSMASQCDLASPESAPTLKRGSANQGLLCEMAKRETLLRRN